MPRDTILSIDLGTSACKAVLFDLAGQALAVASAEYPTYYPQPLWAEQAPEDWWSSALTAARQCLARQPAVKVIAIGLSSQRETIAPLDAAGGVLARAISWMDKRSNPQAEQLAQEFGQDEVRRRTGMRCESTFTATKLLWLKQHQPELLWQSALLLQPRDFLYLRLTGMAVTDYTLASRTMLLDAVRQTWCEDLMAFVGVKPDQFPPLHYSDEAPGGLCGEAAAQLDLLGGTPVAVGAGDRACENLGAGGRLGRLVESTGTTTSLHTPLATYPQPDQRVPCSVHALRGHWLLETGLAASGSILRWYRDLVGAGDYQSLDQLASQVPPGARGVILLPFLMGAKSAHPNPQARGVLAGLTLGTDRGVLARAVMEGVAMEIHAVLQVFATLGVEPAEIISVGGGSKPLWNAIKANITGRRVVRPAQADAA
ncbi:MAG: xylulokinase, partial [Deinococcus sp.]|nr:xylulokinase [Deinococcus sp.]